MAISTNGTVLARVAGALYNTQMSNATYNEVTAVITTSASLNALVNDLYSRDFSSTSDLTVASTLLSNLGLSVTGLDNWVAAQITAAGSANKGAKIVELLNSFAQLTTDATYGTAATNFNAKVDAALALSQTSGNKGATFASTSTSISGTSFSLSTSLDTGASWVGGAGDDTFSGVTSTASTWTTGDSIVGGAGTDTAVLAASGAVTTSEAVASSGVEVLSVFNNSSAAFTADASLMSGLTTVRATGGTAAVTISGLSAQPNAELVSSSQNLTVTTTSTVGTGAADTVSLTLNGAATTASNTVTYNGPETINVVATGATSGSSSKTVTITDADLETINLTGTANVNLTATFSGASLSTQTGTFNASAAGGIVRATLTAGSSGNLSVTGSAQNDVITLGATPTKYMTVDGGAGTDTLSVADGGTYAATNTTQPAGNVTNFETLAVTGGGTVDLRSFAKNTFTAASASAGLTLSKANAELVTVSLTAAGSLTHTLATDGTTDALTVNFASTTTGVTAAAVDEQDIETLTISSGGLDSNTITALTSVDLSKLVVSGAQDFTVTNALTDAVSLATVDASGLTGLDTTFSLNAGVSTKAMTVTLGGGVEGTLGGTVNTITTGYGADSVTGGAYKDVITTGSGNDTVVAGAGNDSITAGLGDDSIDGGTGDDIINGGAGNDVLAGGDGNDTIDGSTGNDTITGGAGNDKIYVASLSDDSNIDGGAGTADTLSLGTTSTTLAASFYTAVTDSAAPTIAGVETGYVQITPTSANTTAALGLTFDMTKVTGMTSLYLNANDSGSNEYVTVKNFGGSSVYLTELPAGTGADVGFLTLDGINQASMTVNVRGYAVGTTANTVTLTGANATSISGTSYVSTAAQTNTLGTVTSAAAAVTLSTSGNTTAANVNALKVDSLTAANATSVTVSVGGLDTLTVTGDIVTTNSLVDTLAVTVSDDSTLTISGGDIDLKSSPVQTATITVGVGSTVSAIDLEAASVNTLTMTLGASSTTALDLNAAITSGTVTMTAGSAWTLDTLGIASAATSLTITGRGDVAEGTVIDIIGSKATFDASGLTDTDGLAVSAADVTGVSTITGTGYTDTITGGLGNDVLSGGAAADTISGGAGDDVITGGTGTGSLVGGDGADTITGGSSADSITGGAGVDSLSGSTGSDIFYFAGQSGTDTGALSTAGSATATVIGTAVTAAATTIADTTTLYWVGNLDRITDFTTGDAVSFTGTGVAAGTAQTLANNTSNYIKGYVVGSVFTAYAAATVATPGGGTTSTAATLAVWDSDTTAAMSFQAVLLVGYVDTTTGGTDAWSATGVTGTA